MDFQDPLERRDVVSNVATWILMSLWNVATLILNVATLLIPLSVTSRRCPERRDVGFSTLCNVATLPRTSRRCPVLRPRTVHFALFLFTSHTPTPPENLALLRTCPPQPCRSSFPHRSEVPPLLSDHPCASQSHPLQLVSGNCGIPITLCSVLALV